MAMNIIVKTQTGPPLLLVVRSEDLVSTVKLHIESAWAIPATHQQLFLHTTELKDGLSLFAYQITHNTWLRLNILPAMNICFTVALPSGCRLPLNMSPQMTVGQMKVKIQDLEGVPVQFQRLIFNGNNLDDTYTLQSYGISSEAIVHLQSFATAVPSVNIFVESSLRCESLDVELTNTVEMLKQKINRKMSIPIGCQKLIFGAKQLEDGHKLSDYNIQQHSKIHVDVFIHRHSQPNADALSKSRRRSANDGTKDSTKSQETTAQEKTDNPQDRKCLTLKDEEPDDSEKMSSSRHPDDDTTHENQSGEPAASLSRSPSAKDAHHQENLTQPDGPIRDSDDFDIFISYEWNMQKKVKELFERLKYYGYRCWMDIGEMEGGQEMFSEIVKGIDKSKVVISCVTPRYADRDNCMKEVVRATQKKKKIIPIILEKTEWPLEGTVGFHLGPLLYIEFHNSPTDMDTWNGPKMDKLLEQLSKFDLPPKVAGTSKTDTALMEF